MFEHEVDEIVSFDDGSKIITTYTIEAKGINDLLEKMGDRCNCLKRHYRGYKNALKINIKYENQSFVIIKKWFNPTLCH